ncbi:MAG: RNA methyltransferase [Desulfobulbaceae bacterium]|nr:RNA methyltransferase [Desulfobulbaceae bacterium]
MTTASPDNREPGITAVILVGPQNPENIGAAARVSYNFGIKRLIIVSDLEFDQERMLKMATHKAAHLIKGMEVYSTTREAVSTLHFIVGTTARQGRNRVVEQTPRAVMDEIAPLAAGNNIGLMFGPENSGLTNEDLDLCQYTSTVPTADFSSLNLAQAVAIHCYELHMRLFYSPEPISSVKDDFPDSHEQEAMYDHIKEVLKKVTFLQESNQIPWMRNVRKLLQRIQLKKKEAKIIRGICRKLLWYEETKETLINEPKKQEEENKVLNGR